MNSATSRHFRMLLPSALAILLAPAAYAQESDGLPNPLEIKVSPGFGGEGEMQIDEERLESDMLTTFGFGIEYDHFLTNTLAVGGLLQVSSWNAEALDDADIGRSLLFDFGPVIKAATQLSPTVYLHAALPVGLSVSMVNDDAVPALAELDVIDDDMEIETGFGLFVQALVGVQVEMSPTVNLLVELGYTYHSITHDIVENDPGDEDNTEGELSMGQITLTAGAAF